MLANLNLLECNYVAVAVVYSSTENCQNNKWEKWKIFFSEAKEN